MKYLLLILFTFISFKGNAEIWPVVIETPTDDIDSAKIYNNLGVDLYFSGDFDNSIRYFKKSVELKRELNYEKIRIANSLLNMGVIYRKMWDYKKAIDVLSSAQEIFENNEEDTRLSNVLLNKGNVYADMGDNQKALEQYRQSINLIDDKANQSNASIIYNNIGTLYMESGEYKDALKAFKKSYKLAERSGNWSDNEMVIKNIAKVYCLMDSTRQADHYYENGLNYYANQQGPSFKKGYLYLDYGKFLFQQKKKEEGLTYLNEGGNMLRSIFGEKHPEMAEYYMEIGQLYLDDEAYKTALNYLQQALISLIPEFNNNDVYQNPKRTNSSRDIALLGIYKRKAIAIYNLHLSNSDKDLLSSGYHCALDGINILEDLKKGYVSEKSRMLLMQHEKEIYPSAVLTALKLYETTAYANYKEDAFTIAERSKASILLASLKTMTAREFGGIPERLINREFDLKKKIALHDEKLYEESKFDEPDSNKIQFWEKKLYKLKNQYYNLIDTFEKQYPGYYKLKYKPEIVSVNDVQSILKRNDALMEYVISENYLITFVVTKSGFDFRIDSISENFNTTLTKVIDYLTNNQFSSNQKSNAQQFIANAAYMHQKLIQPHTSLIRKKSLIIVPDGQLAYLPYEALISDTSDIGLDKFDDLPYLIKKHPVSYAHSSTLLYKAKALSSTNEQKLLAFAPRYNSPDNIPSDIPLVRQKYLNQLYPLPGSKEEVNRVRKIIGGRIFMDEEATEANFKKNAGNYDILHFAMHTLVNYEDPMFTKMVFTQNDDEAEDNFLNTYELYNMKLSARMAVLSSCNTGRGKLEKGEGVISLARGFMYAGCPSVTMSLWEVEDKSGAQLMEYYYENLKAGKSKAVALQQAKIKFLSGADPLKSHPYFWSGFVVIGNHDSLFKRNTGKYITGSSILIAFAVFGWIAYRRRQKKKVKLH